MNERIIRIIKLKSMLVILFFFSVACSPTRDSNSVDAEALVRNPMPVPDFIVATKPQPNTKLSVSESICFGIDEGSIWIPGHDKETISKHLASNTTLTVDNRIYDASDMNMHFLMVVIDRFDDEGNYIGWHDDTMSVCLESHELSTGLHVATIRTTSTKNEEFTYSWAFEVVEDAST